MSWNANNGAIRTPPQTKNLLSNRRGDWFNTDHNNRQSFAESMARLRKKAREMLEGLIRAKKPIPEEYFALANEKQMQELIALGIREENRDFLVQARAKAHFKHLDVMDIPIISRVPLTPQVREKIESRSKKQFDQRMADFHRKEEQRKKAQERSVWVKIVQGGAPGLVQQK